MNKNFSPYIYISYITEKCKQIIAKSLQYGSYILESSPERLPNYWHQYPIKIIIIELNNNMNAVKQFLHTYHIKTYYTIIGICHHDIRNTSIKPPYLDIHTLFHIDEITNLKAHCNSLSVTRGNSITLENINYL